jgi:hypothetical protein
MIYTSNKSVPEMAIAIAVPSFLLQEVNAQRQRPVEIMAPELT